MAATDPYNPHNIIEGNRNNLAIFGFKLMCDGQQDYYFVRVFKKPFLLAMGRITMDGVSLCDVHGGISPANRSGRAHVVPIKMINGAQLPLGNINGVAQVRATEAQERQEDARERRFFACLMEHISPTCALFRELSDDFQGAGPQALNYVVSVCQKSLSPEMAAKLEADWQAASVLALRISIDKVTMHNFMEWVLRKAEDFQPEKSYADCRLKFLSGLPTQMSSEVSVEQMRPDPSYNFPQVYPVTHIRAGVIHPFAGQPDPRKLTAGFTVIWERKIAEGPKSAVTCTYFFGVN